MNTRINLKIKQLLTLIISLSLLASCKVTKDYKSPEVDTDDLYRDLDTDTTNLAQLHWSEVFTDPKLQKLIQEGIDQNLDLKIAYTRIESAEAYFKQSKAAFYPTIGISGSASQSSTGGGQLPSGTSEATGRPSRSSGQFNQLGLTASWEPDLWGKLKSTKQANLSALLQTEAYRKVVQTGLVANIANYYYLLLALDQQLAITKETIANWTKTVETMKELKEAGVVTGAAVVQSEANLYAAEVTLPDLKQSIRETENTISILLSRNPGAIERSKLADQRPVTDLQTGVPSQLLSNRPDVQLAEQGFRQAFQLTNVARAMFYPSFTLSASTGLSSIGLSNFFSSNSIFGSLVAGLTQPIFNKGTNEARLKDAKAQQEEAYFNFQKSLLNAGQEVSNSMYAYQAAMDKKKARYNQIVSLEKSVDYTQELLAYGDANYVEVLTAKQNLLTTQINSTNDYLQQLQSIVNVYRSLGGGWQ